MLLVSAAALAQTPVAVPEAPCKVPTADEAVPSYLDLALELKRCLGNPKRDKHDLTSAVASSLEQQRTLTPAKGVESALGLLLAEVGLRSNDQVDGELWMALGAELAVIRARASELGLVTDASAWRRDAVALVPRKWAGAANGLDLFGKTFDVLTPPVECRDGNPCSAFASRVAALRVINLVARIDAHLEGPLVLQHFAEGRLRLERWEAYRDKAHSLYWWEVFVNGMLMEGSLLSSDNKALCDKEADGTSLGFCRVPTRQLILLHPEAAVRFSRTASKASELKPALVVQLVGWYRWRWASDSSAEMRSRTGISLAASYTATDKEGELGYGPMFHWNNFSFAVTKAKAGRWSLVLSVPLGEKLYGRQQQVIDELSKVQKSSLIELLQR
jgi:hypothetical protein